MYRSFWLAAVAGLLLATPARAQIVDVQRLLAGEQKEGLSGGVDGSIDLRRGDLTLTSLSGGVNARYRRGDLAALLLGKAERAETDAGVYLEKDLEHLRFRWVGARVNAETFFQHDRDLFRRRELRGLWGAGPRVVVLDSEARSLATGLAGMAEYERLSEGAYRDSGEVSIRTRASLYGSGRLKLSEHIALGQTLYLQPRVDEVEDARMLSDTELLVALSAHLSLRLSASLNYDSAPPDTVEEWQTAFKTTFHFDVGAKNSGK